MNMLSNAAPWDLVAEGYAETTMKFFQGYADAALARAGLTPESRVLDVACGPGTLTLAAATRAREVHAIDFSAPMLTILQREMTTRGLRNIEIRCGDAQSLPYDDAQFDVAFSMFGLMFFPDRAKGYAEIHRTLKKSGRIVLSSWAPVAQSPLMQTVFGALRAMNPAIPEPRSIIDSLENPDFFLAELRHAGFKDVEIQCVTQRLTYASIERFWDDMVLGNAPIAVMKNSMSADLWAEKNRIALEYLYRNVGRDGGVLGADAWLAVGTK